MLHTFGRNLDRGALIYLETFTDSVDAMDGQENPWSTAVNSNYILISVTSFGRLVQVFS